MREYHFQRLGERLWEEKLPNGLTIYVLPKRGFSQSFAVLGVNYGGWDERFAVGDRRRSTPAGVAHFLEHKMFDMPEGSAMQTFAAGGASPNAFTAGDVTAYYFSCTDGVYDNLRTLLKMVTTPYFTAETVEKEKSIIAQEILMIEDQVDWRSYRNLMQAMYQHHPIRNSIAGTVESIGKITPEILELCHKSFYHPENMALCVAGDVDPRQVVQIALANTPGAKKQTLRRDHGEEEPVESIVQETECTMEVSGPKFVLGFKVTPQPGMKFTLIGELAAEIVAGSSSPLYASLYRDGLIDKGFSADFSCNGDVANFTFSGESKDPGAVAEAIISEAIRIDWNGVDKQLLERLKKASYGFRVRGLNAMDATCVALMRSHFYGYRLFEFADLIEQVTSEEVEDMIRESLTSSRYTLSVVRPKGV